MSDPIKLTDGSKIYTPGSGNVKGEMTTDNLSRVLPRQLSTGSTRGQQRIGYGNAMLDGNNNRILVSNPSDGTTVGMGNIPGTDGEFGFFSLDSDGTLIQKIVNGTWYIYRKDDTNVMQAGLLPDGTAGWAVAADNHEVGEGF
jgi:hypothetical protein